MAATYRLLEVPVSPPVNTLASDTFEISGNTLTVKRGNAVIATRTIQSPGNDVTSGVIPSARSMTSVFIVEAIPMPGTGTTLTNVRVDTGNGHVLFDFSDGTELEFGSWADALSQTQYLDSLAQTVQHMLILKSVRNSPDGSNMSNMVGGSMLSDFTAQTPIVCTAPIQQQV